MQVVFAIIGVSVLPVIFEVIQARRHGKAQQKLQNPDADTL